MTGPFVMVGVKGRSGGNRQPTKVFATGPGTPPRRPLDLSKPAKKKWDKIVKLIPQRILEPIDVFELRLLANLLVQTDELELAIQQQPSNAANRRLYLQTCREIHKFSVAFGLNPADRAHLGIDAKKDDQEDPITDFLTKIGG